MVVHLGDVLPTSCGSHPIRLGLKSFFGLEIFMHTKLMYPFIISIKDLTNECNVLSNVLRERLTQNSANTRSCLLQQVSSVTSAYLSHLEAGSRTTSSSDSCTMSGYHFLHKTPRMLTGERAGVPDKTNQALHK
jgi:hypothetical protein